MGNVVSSMPRPPLTFPADEVRYILGLVDQSLAACCEKGSTLHHYVTQAQNTTYHLIKIIPSGY